MILLLSPHECTLPPQSALDAARALTQAQNELAQILALCPAGSDINNDATQYTGFSTFYSYPLEVEHIYHAMQILAQLKELLAPFMPCTLIATHSPFWRRILPHLAAHFGLPMIAQLCPKPKPLLEHSICASQYIEQLQLPCAHFCATLAQGGQTTFAQSSILPSFCELKPCNARDTRVELLEAQNMKQSGNLANAELILAAGRGLGSRQNFEKLQTLATRLNAGIGATRAAVDAGFCSPDLQIGQSGHSVAPRRYIAFGLSGSIQHIAGMRHAKEIIVVNTDPSAPIFKYAHYGILADANAVIAQLLQ